MDDFISYYENRFSPLDEETNPTGMATASEKINLTKDPNGEGTLVIAADSYPANLFGKLVKGAVPGAPEEARAKAYAALEAMRAGK